MHIYVPTQEEYEQLRKELAEVRKHIEGLAKPEDRIFDNQEFIKLMKISDKTASNWRSEGKIGYSQEGKKIYYRLSDIELFLEKYHKKPFAKKGMGI